MQQHYIHALKIQNKYVKFKFLMKLLSSQLLSDNNENNADAAVS
jgi:hypothetical protein